MINKQSFIVFFFVNDLLQSKSCLRESTLPSKLSSRIKRTLLEISTWILIDKNYEQMKTTYSS